MILGCSVTINVLAIGRNSYQNSLDLCVTSRALGASEITFIGKKDTQLADYMNKMASKWGGKFKVSFAKSYQEFMKSSDKAIKIYLTRYGTSLTEKSAMISTYKRIVLIVTDKEDVDYINKVADFKISITSQPHCSAAAIAVFLHEYYKGRELAMHFENAKYKISEKGDAEIKRQNGTASSKLP
jgi:tRNA (cytidine56-2'-O)-methyltransferase